MSAPEPTPALREARRLGRRVARDTQGAALISFAFVAPLLMMMSVGIVDVGRALWTHSTIANAAREAARFASVKGADADTPATESDIAAVAIAASPGVALAPTDVFVAWDPSNQPGGRVRVEVRAPFDFMISGFVSLGTIELRSAASRTVF